MAGGSRSKLWLCLAWLGASVCSCVLPEVTTRPSSAGTQAVAAETTRDRATEMPAGSAGTSGTSASSPPAKSAEPRAPETDASTEASCAGCATGAYCIPRIGAPALCLCPRGQVGDGLLCGPDPECEALGCGAFALCVRAAEGLACQCVKGWNGDGHQCVDLDECALEPDLCGPNARCENQFGSYTCTCQPGYERVAGACKATAACSREACGPNADCQAGRCVCSQGFESSGGSCVRKPFCGDGRRDSIEQCDGADLGGQECTDRGFTGGTLACNQGCSFNTGACTGGASARAGAGGS